MPRDFTSTSLQPESRSAHVIRLLWGGTERKGTARLQRVDWTGSLSITKGSLELIDTINFQSCDDGARQIGTDLVEWSNHSAGNSAGVLLRVLGNENTELHLKTSPVELSCRLSNIMSQKQRQEAGGVNRFIELGRAPSPNSSTEFAAEFTDSDCLAGEFAYWIRVTQTDQSLAWSSPVYVTRR